MGPETVTGGLPKQFRHALALGAKRLCRRIELFDHAGGMAPVLRSFGVTEFAQRLRLRCGVLQGRCATSLRLFAAKCAACRSA